MRCCPPSRSQSSLAPPRPASVRPLTREAWLAVGARLDGGRPPPYRAKPTRASNAKGCRSLTSKYDGLPPVETGATSPRFAKIDFTPRLGAPAAGLPRSQQMMFTPGGKVQFPVAVCARLPTGAPSAPPAPAIAACRSTRRAAAGRTTHPPAHPRGGPSSVSG